VCVALALLNGFPLLNGFRRFLCDGGGSIRRHRLDGRNRLDGGNRLNRRFMLLRAHDFEPVCRR
jgi:hypothetical protein